VKMPPPSLPPGRANVADFYAARSGLIPPLPRPTFSPAFSAERIRDKIRASRMKGIWMGGNPPLGYDVKDRKCAR
jgi:hypothetical protein